MNAEIKTKNGYAVRRRCDSCGSRVDTIIFDDGNMCTLKCTRCNKEYSYFFKKPRNDDDLAWIGLVESLKSIG